MGRRWDFVRLGHWQSARWTERSYMLWNGLIFGKTRWWNNKKKSFSISAKSFLLLLNNICLKLVMRPCRMKIFFWESFFLIIFKWKFAISHCQLELPLHFKERWFLRYWRFWPKKELKNIVIHFRTVFSHVSKYLHRGSRTRRRKIL
jgi:hypothetical protein